MFLENSRYSFDEDCAKFVPLYSYFQDISSGAGTQCIIETCHAGLVYFEPSRNVNVSISHCRPET